MVKISTRVLSSYQWSAFQTHLAASCLGEQCFQHFCTVHPTFTVGHFPMGNSQKNLELSFPSWGQVLSHTYHYFWRLPFRLRCVMYISVNNFEVVVRFCICGLSVCGELLSRSLRPLRLLLPLCHLLLHALDGRRLLWPFHRRLHLPHQVQKYLISTSYRLKM